jgi:hypothetical protein
MIRNSIRSHKPAADPVGMSQAPERSPRARDRGSCSRRPSSSHRNAVLTANRAGASPLLIDVLRSARRGESSISLATASPTGRRPIGPVDAAVDVLERQFGQMVWLVDDLLDAGRLSHGGMVLRKQRVELSSVVHHAVEAVRPLSESRGQELTVTLPRVPVYLDADPTRLAQIVGTPASSPTAAGGSGSRWSARRNSEPLAPKRRPGQRHP